jgi:S-adenosylmethionine hydrolase
MRALGGNRAARASSPGTARRAAKLANRGQDALGERPPSARIGAAPPDDETMTPLITFLSDFGHHDWFVGVVHGVLHEGCPAARIVDLAHDLHAGQIERAAFVLEAAAPDFPAGTVHLAVVDPGVGTSRRALAVRAHGQWFVGPDNGLLEWGLADPAAEARELTAEAWFRRPVSRTFHGRDVFAPVAARLASGADFEEVGPVVRDPVRLRRRAPEVGAAGELVGRVMYVDRFGNALTNLTEGELADAFPTVPETRLQVRVAGRIVRGLARSYGDAPVGTILAIIGSSGRLEIAQVGGDASERLGIGEGDAVAVRLDA